MRLQTEKPVIKDYCDLFMFLQEKGFILNQLDDLWFYDINDVSFSENKELLIFSGEIKWHRYTRIIPVAQIFLPESWLFEFLVDSDLLDKKCFRFIDELPTSYFINVENMPEVDRWDADFWTMFFCTMNEAYRESTLINLMKREE